MSEADQREQPEFLESVADGLPSMLAYWDAEQRCRYANRAYAEWFGESPGALVGRHLRELLGPESYAMDLPHIEAALDGSSQRFERVAPRPGGGTGNSLHHYVPDSSRAGCGVSAWRSSRSPP